MADILIAGAGLGGLTAALALIQRGHAVRLFEQAAELREVGAGVQLGANGTRILIALGLQAAMQQVVCAATGKEVRLGTTGQSWSTFDLGETSVERFGAPYWTVHRGDFHRVLLDAVRAASPAAIRARPILADLGVGETAGLLLGGEEFDVFAQRALVAFQGENVVGRLIDHLLRDVALAAHRIDSDDRPFDRQHVEKLRDCHDLIGLLRHFDLTEHEALARGEGGNLMDGGLRALLVAGSAHGLAIDCDHPRGNSRHRGHPGDEAALECIGVQGGEDVAEVIMGRRAILERAETAQQSELPGAEEGDLGEAFRAGQYGQQTQKQHLVERIGHLAALAWVRQVSEMTQKDNRLGQCRTVRCRAVHGHSPPNQSRTDMGSAL